MLIIFDIDGTLCDTHAVDARCYSDAFEAVTGRSLATVDWSRYPEATASAIVHALLKEMDISDADVVEGQIRAEVLQRLNDRASDPEWFRPIDGAIELFGDLKRRKEHSIAIATGDWQESARFKLRRTGFDADGVPFASSSDARRRADIIALAAARAGFVTNHAVYVGDGPWDLRATRELGMRFIGVGRRHELLRQQGASVVMPTFRDREVFFDALDFMQ